MPQRPAASVGIAEFDYDPTAALAAAGAKQIKAKEAGIEAAQTKRASTTQTLLDAAEVTTKLNSDKVNIIEPKLKEFYSKYVTALQNQDYQLTPIQQLEAKKDIATMKALATISDKQADDYYLTQQYIIKNQDKLDMDKTEENLNILVDTPTWLKNNKDNPRYEAVKSQYDLAGSQLEFREMYGKTKDYLPVLKDVPEKPFDVLESLKGVSGSTSETKTPSIGTEFITTTTKKVPDAVKNKELATEVYSTGLANTGKSMKEEYKKMYDADLAAGIIDKKTYPTVEAYAVPKIQKIIESKLSTETGTTVSHYSKAKGDGDEDEINLDNLVPQTKTVVVKLGGQPVPVKTKFKENPFAKPIEAATGVKYTYNPTTGETNVPLAEKAYTLYGISKVKTQSGDIIMAVTAGSDGSILYVPYEGNVKKLIDAKHTIIGAKGYVPAYEELDDILSGKKNIPGETTTTTPKTTGKTYKTPKVSLK